MNIALIGGSGFVGSNLLPALTARGHHCIVLTRDPERCRPLQLVQGVQLRRANPYDAEDLQKALEGVDAVVNLVGILNERGRSGKGFHKAHVALTESLITASKGAGVKRILYVSALNADSQNPKASHYLRTKGEAEDLLRASGLQFTIVQPSVIFGVDDSFFNRFAGLLRFIPLLPLACPGARMQPVWVGDVAEAIATALDSREAVGQTYALVGPKQASLLQLVRFTASAMGKKRLVIGLPDALSRLQGLVFDFVPGKPFSSDNYRSLQIDNVSAHNALPQLGIEPLPYNGLMRSHLGGCTHQSRLDALRRSPRRRY